MKKYTIIEIVEFEKNLFEYTKSSVEDLVLEHCIKTQIIHPTDIASKTEKYKWIKHICTSIVASTRVLTDESNENINYNNVNKLTLQKNNLVKIIIKEISKRLYNTPSDYRWYQ